MLCRSLPSLHPAGGGGHHGPLIGGPSPQLGAGMPWVKPGHSVLIHLMEGCRHPGVGVHPRGTGRVELGLRLYVWRAVGLELDARV